MEVGYAIVHHPLVIAEDLTRIDPYWRHEIRDAVRAKLTTSPEVFGKPLRQSLAGHRALRVSDYRVVYRIEKKIVRIIAVIHRPTEDKGKEQRLR